VFMASDAFRGFDCVDPFRLYTSLIKRHAPVGGLFEYIDLVVW